MSHRGTVRSEHLLLSWPLPAWLNIGVTYIFPFLTKMHPIENNQSSMNISVLDSIEIKRQNIPTDIMGVRLGFKLLKGKDNSCLLKDIFFNSYY